LILSGLILAVGWSAFSFGIFFIGHDGLRLDADRLDTLMLVMLVFIAIANVYLIRERRLFWRSMPGKWLVLASGFDLIAVTFLATNGILMAKVDFTLISALFMATVGFMLLLDIVKVVSFRRFGIQ